MSNHHILVVFGKSTNHFYSIVEDVEEKFLNSSKMQVNLGELLGWKTGKIMYRGSYEKCEEKGKNLTDNGELVSSSIESCREDEGGKIEKSKKLLSKF